MSLAIIALGSNLGQKLEYIQNACDLLKSVGIIKQTGGLYKSSAYGNTEQPDFLNTAIALETEFSPIALLEQLKSIEKQLGRKKRTHWGPREIDLDIIFYDNIIMKNERLEIPHPDFHNRVFVLKPVQDFAANLVSPIHNKNIKQLLEDCSDKTTIELLSSDWNIDGSKI